MEKIVELTKRILNNKGDINELKEELDKELTPTGKLSKLLPLINENELNEENYEFMLKLSSKNEELYSQINKLKELKELKKTQNDLEELKINLEETQTELKRQIDSLENTTKTKLNIPIVSTIQKKVLEIKNKDILKTKFNQIIKTIEQSKLKSENKNLKEQYTSKKELKETLDLIHKNCEVENINELKRLGEIANDKYKSILEDIDKDIKKYSLEYKNKRPIIESFDKRLRENTYQKKNDYITLAIEKLSKKELINYDKAENEYEINEPNEKDNYELIIYSLIALYLTRKKENSKIKMTYISKKIPETAEIKKETKSKTLKKTDNSKKKK